MTIKSVNIIFDQMAKTVSRIVSQDAVDTQALQQLGHGVISDLSEVHGLQGEKLEVSMGWITGRKNVGLVELANNVRMIGQIAPKLHHILCCWKS